jgi:hypothetical protein
MKRFFIITLFFFIASGISAQGYNQALGIRAGWISPGIEYRYYPSDMYSLKGLLALRDRGIQLNGLVEFYKYDLFPFSYKLVFYYGAGAHVGFESWDKITFVDNQRISEVQSSFLTGLDGLIGLEYLFYEAPVKVGIEVKPFFDVFGRYGFNVVLPDFAFTVKYLF